MMEAQDLRIGNFLKAAEPEHKGKIFAIDAGDILEIQKGQPRYKYEPILLTPEILEKCGFEKKLVMGSKTDYWYQLGELSYNESHNGWWFRGKFSSIDCLHQLQNLYYALTGTELEIQLP